MGVLLFVQILVNSCNEEEYCINCYYQRKNGLPICLDPSCSKLVMFVKNSSLELYAVATLSMIGMITILVIRFDSYLESNNYFEIRSQINKTESIPAETKARVKNSSENTNFSDFIPLKKSSSKRNRHRVSDQAKETCYS